MYVLQESQNVNAVNICIYKVCVFYRLSSMTAHWTSNKDHNGGKVGSSLLFLQVQQAGCIIHGFVSVQ